MRTKRCPLRYTVRLGPDMTFMLRRMQPPQSRYGVQTRHYSLFPFSFPFFPLFTAPKLLNPEACYKLWLASSKSHVIPASSMTPRRDNFWLVKSLFHCARASWKRNMCNYSCTRNVKVFSVFEPQGCGTRQRDLKSCGWGWVCLSKYYPYFAMLLMSMMQVQINM